METNSSNKLSHSQTYRIMVFSWNTESVSLAETMNPEIAEYNRTSSSIYVPGLTTWHHAYIIPDFYPKLARKIKNEDPDLVVIGFQEDRFPGSYFHSHLLPEEMPKIGYGLVKRTKLMGVGVTTYKGLLNGDLFERGLRISVYAKKDLVSIIEKEEINMRTSIGNDGQEAYICSSVFTRGKGAVASYIMLPGFGRLAFLCCHLPFDARSLILERKYKNQMLRQNAVNKCNICFNNIIENLVLFKDPIPTHVIYFGDFNYRLADHRSASEVSALFNTLGNDAVFLQDMYQQYDELVEQMRRKNIYEFNEGISNGGPTFLPTCKMVKNREQKENKLIKELWNMDSWNEKDSQNIVQQSKDSWDRTLDPKNSWDKTLESKDSWDRTLESKDSWDRTLESKDSWETGKEDQRVPSWCDRILYRTFNDYDHHSLKCTDYDRFDVGEAMSRSDHAAVIGVFELS